ncbi:hypothetical protein CWB79_22735, partial [Pseudoalteromonas sp. S1649]
MRPDGDRRVRYEPYVLTLLRYFLFSQNETAILNASFSHADHTCLDTDQQQIVQHNKIAKRFDEHWGVTTLNNDLLQENEQQLDLINH